VNTQHARGTLAAVLAAAAIAAMTHVPAAIAADADASASRPSASATTLFVEDPEGNAFRLIHVDGSGWKYASGWPASTEKRTPFRKVALGAAAEPQPKAAEVPSDEPLTVFIDGPSGFTYVWNRDDGWTFVGKLATRHP
jgi:hypothetical protein